MSQEMERHAIEHFISIGLCKHDLTKKEWIQKMNVHSFPPKNPQQNQSAAYAPWRNELIYDAKNDLRPVLANAVTIMRNASEWDGVIGFDEFSTQMVIQKSLPWEKSPKKIGKQWSDSDSLLAADWLQRDGLLIKPDIVYQAVDIISKEHAYHPVREFIEALAWDGKDRVGRWLSTYFGVEDSEYVRAVGQRWLIAAIARIFDPGSKVDNMLILEGLQGLGKSRALKALAGDWFTDHLPDLRDKDARLQINGKWIIEVAELAGMTKAETNKVKAFLSADHDRFRPPYGRTTVEFPRQCVFAGTTNVTDYLQDETGGRRFWPVWCTKADAELIAQDREQLWAEAYVLFQSGEKWWLDEPHLISMAKEQQDDRYEGDPWEVLIDPFLSDGDSLAVSDLLVQAIDIPTERWTQRDQTRVAKILRSRGWKRRQIRMEGGKREWRYFPEAA